MIQDPNEWLRVENDKLLSKGARTRHGVTRKYVHFDGKCSPEAITTIINDQSGIEYHPFSPFLSFEKKLRRYRYKDDPKRRVKVRQLSYASHVDAFIYSWFAFQLQQPYEDTLRREGLSDSVIAYRSLSEDDETLSTIDYAYDVFDCIRQRGQCAAVTLDIKQFFDQLHHAHLKKMWCAMLDLDRLPEDHYKVFRSLTKFAFVARDAALTALDIEKSALKKMSRLCSQQEYYAKIHDSGLIQTNANYCRQRGIPQGTPISGLLSNIYLLDFDRDVLSLVNSIGGLYRRYCDDVVVVCPADQAEQVASKTQELIRKVQLEIQPDKTDVIYFRSTERGLVSCKEREGISTRKPMQYLGFEFDGRHSYLRPSTIARFLRKMVRHIDRQVAIRTRHWRGAAGNGNTNAPRLNQQKILSKFTHFGRKNLQSYARRADEKQDDMSRIPQQLKRLEKRVRTEMVKADQELQKLLQ